MQRGDVFRSTFRARASSKSVKVAYIQFSYISVSSMSTNAIDAAKKGSADLLILALLEDSTFHGYEIARRIEARSGGTLSFTLASLYATLYRLEERGLLKGRWLERVSARRRRYYRITPKGRKVLAAQRADWRRFIDAVTELAGLEPV